MEINEEFSTQQNKKDDMKNISQFKDLNNQHSRDGKITTYAEVLRSREKNKNSKSQKTDSLVQDDGTSAHNTAYPGCVSDNISDNFPGLEVKSALRTENESLTVFNEHMRRHLFPEISKYRCTEGIPFRQEDEILPDAESLSSIRKEDKVDTDSLLSSDMLRFVKVREESLIVESQIPASSLREDPIGARSIHTQYTNPPYIISSWVSPAISRTPLQNNRRVFDKDDYSLLQLNQYKLLRDIGQGSYGIVKLVYNQVDKTYYAMKILSKRKLMKKSGIFGRMTPGSRKNSTPLAKLYKEIALLKKLDHPNLVRLIEVLDNPDEDNLYLVFEFVQKGEIIHIPSDDPIEEERARKYFRDIVLGIEYLHYQRIIHRDIKPSNLLVDLEDRIKIADLGVSAELRTKDELLTGAAGTPAFAAPETTLPDAAYPGTFCDIWSLGVTLYSMLTGRLPWVGDGSIMGVQAAVRNEPLRFPDAPKLSPNLHELIGMMLKKEPFERITLSQIKHHRWVTKDGLEPLPSEQDNCKFPVTVTDEEVETVITRVPRLDTLILIKTMLKQHSFQNPFQKTESNSPTYDSKSQKDIATPSTSNTDIQVENESENPTAEFCKLRTSDSPD